jgi:hypothetical protein
MHAYSVQVPSAPVNRFVWPGLLIAGPAAVIIASIVTWLFVVRHPDGLVASDYYKQGKAINAQLSQLRRAQQLGMDRMSVALSANALRLSFPASRDAVSIAVTLAHPVDPEQDIRAVLPPTATGEYELTLRVPLAERRRVVVTDSPAHSWRVESLLAPIKGQCVGIRNACAR